MSEREPLVLMEWDEYGGGCELIAEPSSWENNIARITLTHCGCLFDLPREQAMQLRDYLTGIIEEGRL